MKGKGEGGRENEEDSCQRCLPRAHPTDIDNQRQIYLSCKTSRSRPKALLQCSTLFKVFFRVWKGGEERTQLIALFSFTDEAATCKVWLQGVKMWLRECLIYCNSSSRPIWRKLQITSKKKEGAQSKRRRGLTVFRNNLDLDEKEWENTKETWEFSWLRGKIRAG